MTTHPRVLVTNDDGIDSPGLRWLARALSDDGLDVVVAAPMREASGSSAAITATEQDGRVVVEERTLPNLEDVPTYAVAASPSFIVLIAARDAFGRAPDLVIAGINRGANAGFAVLHSGTVGAALTAAAHGFRGMAVSLDVLSPANTGGGAGGDAVTDMVTANDEVRHWRTAAELAVSLVPTLRSSPVDTVLNLNVPDLPLNRVLGPCRAGLARFGQVQMNVAEVGKGYVRMALEESGSPKEAGTDLALLAEHYATVTPIRTVGEAVDVVLPGLARPVPVGVR